MKPKFKIGDKVIVIEDPEDEELPQLGVILTIRKIDILDVPDRVLYLFVETLYGAYEDEIMLLKKQVTDWKKVLSK